MNKLDGKSLDLEKMNIEKIKELFPNVVTEGKIDFEKLRLILGDEIEERVERYQFTWNGKSDSIRLAQTPSTGTLIPSKEDSKNWDTTENLYIEGDNLEVLKQLQKTYFGKIKMIYIDPPYNTGGDFVYKDDFKDNIKNYKEQTSQTLRANPETAGRYHTDWLNMMYPRLMLAKNLLSDDGAIFISIDENESHNLKKICDEIFSENNFVGETIRKTKSMTADKNTNFNNQHEHLIIYSKNAMNFSLIGDEKEFKGYSNPDNDPNGDWISGDPSAKSGSESTFFPIKNPYTGQIDYPPKGRYWAFSKETLDNYIREGKITFNRENKGGRGFVFKRYKNQIENRYNPFNSLQFLENKYMNQHATKEINELFDEYIFDYPKPVVFLKKIIKAIKSNNFYVMDFFAGSSTTAHAVMQLNAEDGGNRKFIMVQLPEITDEKSEAYKAGYENLADIGKERIRRAGEQIKRELIDKKEKAGLLVEDVVDPESLDIGFKVFKLETTNIIPWDSSIKLDESTLFDQIEVIKEDRTNLDVLYEIMLKYGVFDKPVEEIKVNNKTMYNIGLGYLIVCLDNNITMDDIKEIGRLKPKNVIFNEAGFENDNDKINATYTLERLGVEEIKSI